MIPVTIRHCVFDEIASLPEFVELAQEYANESKIEEMPEHSLNVDAYRAMEKAGIYSLIGAFSGKLLIGFVGVIVNNVPHFKIKIATAESYFVGKKHRNTGAGIKLLKAAEELASERGAINLFVSAPIGSRIEQVLPRHGYRACQQIFCRSLA